MDALEQCKAWEAVHDPRISGDLGMDKFLDLMKAAGYQEQAAQKAATKRGFSRLEQGLAP